jgi:hypothetical protein
MTFKEFKRETPQGDLGAETDIQMTKSLERSIDEYFVSLLCFQAQLKIMHWGTDSYSQHKAYMKTYDSVDAGLDALVESYQGYHGLIDFGSSCEFISFTNVEVNSWLESMIECLNTIRGKFKESDLQNLSDELITGISKLKYLLTLK